LSLKNSLVLVAAGASKTPSPKPHGEALRRVAAGDHRFFDEKTLRGDPEKPSDSVNHVGFHKSGIPKQAAV